MTALYTLAVQSPPRTRITFWVGFVALFAVSLLLPDLLGTIVRIALVGVLFVVIGMALHRGEGRPFQVILWSTLALIFVVSGVMALFG